MSKYDIDFEIIYVIKNGNHRFGKIWTEIKKSKIGAKQTFSNHLAQLVKDEVIAKRIENKIPQYFLNEIEHYDKAEQMREQIQNKISLIIKNNKKYSNKKLLKIFVKETKMDLTFYSVFHFTTLMPSYQTDKVIDAKKLELLDKVIKTRIDILQKRDPKLVIMFNDLIKNQLLSDYL